jgi:hypothetical protein
MTDTSSQTALMNTLFVLRLLLYVALGFAALITPMLLAVCLSDIRKELDPVVRPDAQPPVPAAAE